MNKVFVITITAVLIVTATACSSIYSMLGTDKEAVREKVVDKAQEYAIAYANKKIDKIDGITDEKRVELKAEAKVLIDKAFLKLDEIHAKYEAQKVLKAEAKKAGTVLVKTTESAVVAKPAADVVK